MDDKIKQAVDAGYTSSEIADHLANDANLGSKIAQARQAGYSDDEIIWHLSTVKATPSPKPAESASDTAQPIKESKLKVPEYNRGMEGVRSALRGATIGLSDVAGAGLGALGYKGLEAVGAVPESGQTLGELYKEMKTNQAATRDKYREEHPYESAGLEIAGAVAPMLVTGGMSGIAEGGTVGGMQVAGTTGQSIAQTTNAIGGAIKSLPYVGKAAGAILPSAAMGATYGASEADVGKELEGAKQGGEIGALIGAGLPIVSGAAKSIISPAASTNKALQTVLEEGGKPTIGMALGGRANALEEKLTSLPIMGDMISVARNKAVQSLEPAAYNRALSPVGQKLPKGVTGRDAIIHTENVLKTKYDDVLNKIGAITPDNTFTTKVQSLEQMVNDIKMPQEQKAKFAMALDDVKSSIDSNGVMTSQAYKELESNLGTIARKLGSSQDIYEGKMAPAVKQLQAELRDMLERQAGSYAKELKNANKGWANYKVLQKAAGGIGAAEGKFTPTQLQSAVRAADKSKDKSAFGKGNALMQDLSEAGKTVMGNKVGNSFTADRAFMGLGALASGGVNPAIPTSLAGGAAIYTEPAQRALVALVAKRPDVARKLVENNSTNEMILDAARNAGLITAQQGNN